MRHSINPERSGQVVHVTDLAFSFRRHQVLRDITLTIEPGLTGLIGPNGSGKTTLLRLLATVHSVRDGDITFGSASIRDREGRDAARRMTGYLPQAFGAFPDFSVREFVSYCGLMRGIDRTTIDELVDRALDLTDLTQRQHSRMGRLSGGQRRRAGIAQAIVHRPSVLLLDEPSAGLDPDQRVGLRELLRDLAEEITVLVSTHILGDIADVSAARLIALVDGELRYAGPVSSLPGLTMGAAPDERALETACHHLLQPDHPTAQVA